MIKRIELTNFMSHAHSVFDLAEGLNVLAGPNNCGKSAVVTALQILCYNDNSTYVLRHGAKQCRVLVETDDGHVVIWGRKRSGSPYYEIDGQRFDRLGKNKVPDALHDVLRLPRIQSDKDKFDVHFGEQRSPVFLLNEKAGRAADFFASSSDARHLLEMQSLHKTRVRDANALQKRLQSEAAALDASLDRLEPLDSMDSELQSIEAEWQKLQQQEERTLHLHHLSMGMIQASSTIDGLKRQVQELKALPDPPQLPDASPLARMIQALQATTREWERLESRALALQPLCPLPACEDPQPLRDMITQNKRLRHELALLDRKNRCMQRILPPPQLQDETPLTQLLAQWRAARNTCQQLQQELVTVEQGISDTRHQVEAWTQRHPECPTCGSPLVWQHLLEGGHRHGAIDSK